MDTRKTQLLSGTAQVSDTAGDYNFNAGTDTLEIKLAAQKNYVLQVERVDGANKLVGDGRIVTNPAGLATQKSEALKYGASNEKNIQALGFVGMDRLHESFAISSSVKFDGYWLRDGSIGFVNNFPYNFQSGTSLADKRWYISPMKCLSCVAE